MEVITLDKFALAGVYLSPHFLVSCEQPIKTHGLGQALHFSLTAVRTMVILYKFSSR